MGWREGEKPPPRPPANQPPASRPGALPSQTTGRLGEPGWARRRARWGSSTAGRWQNGNADPGFLAPGSVSYIVLPDILIVYTRGPEPGVILTLPFPGDSWQCLLTLLVVILVWEVLKASSGSSPGRSPTMRNYQGHGLRVPKLRNTGLHSTTCYD